MKMFLGLLLLGTMSFSAYSACTVADAEAAVKKACEAFNAKGEAAYAELADFRFCGDKNNYVWSQNIDPNNKEVTVAWHPVSPGLANRDMMKSDKVDVKELFTKLDKTLRTSKLGKPAVVEYDWTKPGDAKPTKKKSVMMKCNDKLGFGGGFWP